MRKFFSFVITLAASFWLSSTDCRGVILYRTGDPEVNATEPTGDLAGSGWQYEGLFGPFLGTAIGPHFFLTADHIGQPSNIFTLQGVNYTIVGSQKDPGSDLHVYEVAETLPAYAPLYSAQDEAGKQLVVFGCGTQRGSEITTNGIFNGWKWGASDMRERWGENNVAIAGYITLSSTFDATGLPNECALSSGDSGGGLFIQNNGQWQLAGINLSVGGTCYTDEGEVVAALVDARGTYTDGSRTQIKTGPVPQPSSFLATRISQRLDWLHSVIGTPPAAPTGVHIGP
jgi:hypothetical protein